MLNVVEILSNERRRNKKSCKSDINILSSSFTQNIWRSLVAIIANKSRKTVNF